MRLRFSLATLVLLVLLLASSATFWWNWYEWQPVAFRKTGDWISAMGYFDGGRKYFCSTTRGNGSTTTVEVIDSATQRTLGTYSMLCNQPAQCLILHNGKYLCLQAGSRHKDGERAGRLWNLETGEELSAQVPDLKSLWIDRVSNDGRTVLIWNVDTESNYLARAPSFEKIAHLYTWPDNLINVISGQPDFAFGYGWKIERLNLTVYTMDGTLFTSLEFPEKRGWIHGKAACNSRFVVVAEGVTVATNNGPKDCGVRVVGNLAVYDRESGKRVKALPFEVPNTPFYLAQNSNHLAYVDSKHQLHLADIQTDEDKVLDNATYVISHDGRNIHSALMSWDGDSGALRYDIRNDVLANGVSISYSEPANRFMFVQKADTSRITLFDAIRGKSLGTLSRFRYRKELEQPQQSLAFSKSGDDFISFGWDANRAGQYTVWRHVMPNLWIGALTMPEFWGIILFGMALVWNFWRNRRRVITGATS